MSLKQTKTFRSFSSEETKKFGEELGKNLWKKIARGKNAAVFALAGDLGAGKTTFVQGFFNGLGLKKRSPSPTFIIMRRRSVPRAPRRATAHSPRRAALSDIFHVDAYRLKNAAHLAALDFENVLSNPRNVVLIEWADRVKKILPKDAVWLTFRHGKRENERYIIMKR